jgi:hypothetical protein
MGGCFSVKSKIVTQTHQDQEQMLEYQPLFTLKEQLLNYLNMVDAHNFSVFCTYRFKGSMRAEPEFKMCID